MNALVLDVTLPVNSEGKICLPLAGLINPVVTESGNVIYEDASFYPGCCGCCRRKREEDYLIFYAGSGTYSFWIGEGH